MSPDDYMAKASRAIASAQLLLDAGDVDGACNRAYYAMFDAAHAQGFAQDVFQPQRAAGGTATGATAAQPAQPGVALPVIGNAAQQRQRTGRQAAQPFELIPQSLILPL